jgi:hypothetical protein
MLPENYQIRKEQMEFIHEAAKALRSAREGISALLGTLLFRSPSALDGFPGSIQQMQLVPVSLLQG